MNVQDGPFAWPKDIQGHVLGSYFYGYVPSQMVSGLIAERLGAKWVMFVFVSVSTLSMLLTPIAAELGYQAVIVVRIVAGIGSVSL